MPWVSVNKRWCVDFFVKFYHCKFRINRIFQCRSDLAEFFVFLRKTLSRFYTNCLEVVKWLWHRRCVFYFTRKVCKSFSHFENADQISIFTLIAKDLAPLAEIWTLWNSLFVLQISSLLMDAKTFRNSYSHVYNKKDVMKNLESFLGVNLQWRPCFGGLVSFFTKLWSPSIIMEESALF